MVQPMIIIPFGLLSFIRKGELGLEESPRRPATNQKMEKREKGSKEGKSEGRRTQEERGG